MLFKHVSINSAETVFAVCKNVSGGTLTAGYSCVWDTSTPDGVRVTQNAAATNTLYAGVADADIANNAYGLLQIWGYRASAYIWYNSVAIVVGDSLGPYASADWGLARTAAGAAGALLSYAVALEAQDSAAAAAHTTKPVFLYAF